MSAGEPKQPPPELAAHEPEDDAPDDPLPPPGMVDEDLPEDEAAMLARAKARLAKTNPELLALTQRLSRKLHKPES